MPEFRTLSVGEVGIAFELYSAVCGWLKSAGVRQWLSPSAIEHFARRQARSELWGYFTEAGLVAIVMLSYESAPEWAPEIGSESRWWLKTLAVERGSAGRRIGETVIAQCQFVVAGRGGERIWIDCVDGFLAEYYRRLGFEVHESKSITYASGYSYPMVLMSHQTPIRSSQRGSLQ